MDQSGYATDGGQAYKSCFAAKTLSEQVKECEKVVDKVHSIFNYLNIPVSSYDPKLDDLKSTVSNFNDSLK